MATHSPLTPNTDTDTDTHPLGPLLPPIAATFPPQTPLTGKHVRLQPLDPSDAPTLFETLSTPSLWTYMPDGPYTSLSTFTSSLTTKSLSTDPLFFTVIDTTTPSLDPSSSSHDGNNTKPKAVGHVAFMRISLPHRTIELGNIIFSSSVHRSTLTTETIYLMLKACFDDWGYRRVEWKCDARNSASRRAAVRFGFVFEGVWLQHFIVKGRNRDTAWFGVCDFMWCGWVRAGFEMWFGELEVVGDGARQKIGLAECIRVKREEWEKVGGRGLSD